MFQIWGKGEDQNFCQFLLTGPALLNFIKILSLFNTQPNRPRASIAIFKHVEQVNYSRGFKFGADQNFCPFLLTGPALLNFIKILSLFNTQPNRPRASPAIFKHVGQVPYSRGFKFGADQNFGPYWLTGLALLNFIKILNLFNTQPYRPRASPAIFKHVGQVPYSRGFKFGADQNFCQFLLIGPALLNFIKILSRFNTLTYKSRASNAIFKHVGQVPYSRGFKFLKKGLIKILAHFCLQVRRC